jgi:hypothetical protein
MGEESLSDPPLPKRVTGDVGNCNLKSSIVGEGMQNHGIPGDSLHLQHHAGQGMLLDFLFYRNYKMYLKILMIDITLCNM